MIPNNKVYPLSILFLTLLFSSLSSVGQIVLHDKKFHVDTKIFSQTDSGALKLDIYYSGKITETKPTVLFVFGGGFVMGRRDSKLFDQYFNALIAHDYKVVSVDYRLGLKGKKFPSPFNTSNLKAAIDTATADVFDATAYLIKNAKELGIDTAMIILSGSSAGAITALHADYNKRNATALSAKLPPHFQYKGVISFAGAILSYHGAPKYAITPAPTMLFHGTADKLVPYNKVRLLNRGFFGSKYLARTFSKNGYPYYFQYVQNMGHEIAGSPMVENLPDILWFIENYIIKQKRYFMEVDFKDADKKPTFSIPPALKKR
ncbi:alpha/beta hydrolase [Pedobacter riviphilus]|uniref:Alpha/beta hydrolase n=1 Tax=Pedobacter riviphilus TaxID=2766984 RepID=A0ABX6TDL6_9SPHI|nr:alpha/beta hydrolase [Pedobacter riviphilus]QNR82737.1 alpha/beta hydrolase [Pedobacter riviphilus]